jgi:hypothetical protein
VAWNDKIEIRNRRGLRAVGPPEKNLLTRPAFSLVRPTLFFADEGPGRVAEEKIKIFFKNR